MYRCPVFGNDQIVAHYPLILNDVTGLEVIYNIMATQSDYRVAELYFEFDHRGTPGQGDSIFMGDGASAGYSGQSSQSNHTQLRGDSRQESTVAHLGNEIEGDSSESDVNSEQDVANVSEPDIETQPFVNAQPPREYTPQAISHIYQTISVT